LKVHSRYFAANGSQNRSAAITSAEVTANPITGTAGRCARKASGQLATDTVITLMKSRRHVAFSKA
jgi:hypothetical protein